MVSAARILVVEDEANIRSLLEDMLTRDGYNVETVESGEAALERTNTQLFDLALIDLKLPGMNGIQLMEALRQQLPEIVAATPPERLLVETDAPFLSPHPFRGKRNEPARVELIAARLAELKNLSFGEMSRQLTKNTISLFNLPNLANTDRNSGDVGPP